MAQFVMTIPDDAQKLLVESFCENFGYQDTLADGSRNPQPATEFAQGKIVAYCKAVVAEYRGNVAAAAARAAAQKQVDAIPVTIESK